jgi:asparagine synthase (glutamine-hydrolysing)
MCGIAGVFSNTSLSFSLSESVKLMADAISHRGPDDGGVWFDNQKGVALSHRRLSIIDLSTAGYQPMVSSTGRYIIVFNGEIYNHHDLRLLLNSDKDSLSWRGTSDTETLLAGFDQWGIEITIKKVIGMFSFAVYDKNSHNIVLGRDRAGEKPLYYGWQNGFFLFGSELKSLKAFPGFKGEIDRKSISLQLRYSYIPEPYTIYKGIYKLNKGCLLTINVNAAVTGFINDPFPYWSLSDVVNKGNIDRFTGSDNEAIDALDVLMQNTVQNQMMTDVPLGAFLSGGIDSSLIVSLMQSQSTYPVKTFSIGFNEMEYNEALHAKAISSYLGTDHTELYVSPRDAMNVIPLLPYIYDEPFSDPSQIPTYLLAKLTRQKVTVSLSGDAGDELFGGYNRYYWLHTIWRYVGFLPLPIRRILQRVLLFTSPGGWNHLLSTLGVLLPSNLRHMNIGDKIHKVANLIDSDSSLDMYSKLVSHGMESMSLVKGVTGDPVTTLNGQLFNGHDIEFIEKMMYLDSITYLPDDILVKVDRAAMASSLETRIPMLDHRIIEFSWRLPLHMKIRDGQSKWILRQLLYKYIPKDLVERPKTGFGIPIGLWLRGPLRDWAENLLDESRLNNEGYLHSDKIRDKWTEHVLGKRNWQDLLWNILMFQAWLEVENR